MHCLWIIFKKRKQHHEHLAIVLELIPVKNTMNHGHVNKNADQQAHGLQVKEYKKDCRQWSLSLN